MPLRLEIKKKLSARSERVKCVDFHPNEPWILASLYSGHVFVWNFVSQSMVKSVEVCDLPVRTAKFIPQKQWIICGADDFKLRIYNYNTMERLHQFEAHSDYIRSIAVHPTLPQVLSSSDDMTIKLWDWEKGWECQRVYSDHSHYVMQVEFNPKDTDTFASASLDGTIKIWGRNSSQSYFSLAGHDRGVNCIGYYRGGDKPYLVSGADDHTIKVWDYQTKACIATLEGHTNNISSVYFHPSLPLILSGSEDGTVRLWHSNTYRLENTLNYGMERVWAITCLKGSNKVAIGYDDGTIMIKIGHEEPVVSMERGGKVCWAVNHQIVSANVKTANDIPDGDRLPLVAKDLGDPSELYPQSLIHSPNGRLIAVCGDGKYDICTALTLKQKSHGDALEFVWAEDAGMYATRESSSKVRIFKDFKDHKPVKLSFACEGIFGGPLLAIRSADFVDFVDWEECRIIRRIDVVPRKIFWSESGELVVLACDASFFVLRYNKELVSKFGGDVEISEQGIEGSFELEQEVGEKIRNGHFVGDCFIYTNTAGRLNYYVGGEVMTLAHLNKPMYLLGYLPKENRVYLMDKAHNMYSYALLLSTLVYQTAIVRRDFDGARKALSSIPVSEHTKIARFLEGQDLKELALQVTQDQEHKFELAITCKKLQLARQILIELGDAAAGEQKWKTLGDVALAPSDPLLFDLTLAEEAYVKAGDMGGLLLIYSSTADAAGIERLAVMAEAAGRNNISFLCYFLLRKVSDSIRLLAESDRIPEAAFMTRTYAPSSISRILALWKENLAKVSSKAAEALADPNDYEELFPELKVSVEVERYVRVHETELLPSILYGDYSQHVLRNLIAEMKEGQLEQVTEEEYQQQQPEPEPQAQAHVPAQPAPVQEVRPTMPVFAAAAPVPVPAPVQSFERPAALATSPIAAPAPVAATPSPSVPFVPSQTSPVIASALSSPAVVPPPKTATPIAVTPVATPTPTSSFAPSPSAIAPPSAMSPAGTAAPTPSPAATPQSYDAIDFFSAKTITPVASAIIAPAATASPSPIASPTVAAAPIVAVSPPAAVASTPSPLPAFEPEVDEYPLDADLSSSPSHAPPTTTGLDDINSILADAGIEDEDFGDFE